MDVGNTNTVIGLYDGEVLAADWRMSTIHERMADEWAAMLEGTDACVAPVLSLSEAHAHPHNRARGTFLEKEGILQPAPAPRFSRTPPEISRPASAPGADTDDVLGAWGLDATEIGKLREAGAVG